jgi:hypothetical protein
MDPTANSNLTKQSGSMKALYTVAAVFAAALLFLYLLV